MSKSPSIRRLIRQGIAFQLILTTLILVGIFVVFFTRIELVSQQEHGTRAIGELRRATVDLLATVESIDKYSRQARPEQLAAYRQSVSALRGDLLRARRWLDGTSGASVDRAARGVDAWRTDVLEHAVGSVQRGDRTAAQRLLLSPKNDLAIRAVGLPISSTMDQRVSQQLRAERNARTVSIVVVGVAVVALLGLMTAAIAFLLPMRTRVADPLDELADASAKIGSGDFSARVKPHGTRETELAAAAFNHMADIVEAHIEELRELDRMKDEFVASVSHELRTPITSISGYVDMQLKGEIGDLSEAQRANLDVVARNAAQLAALIDDLLTVATLESQGAGVLERTDVDVADVLSDIVAELRPLAGANHTRVVLHTADAANVSADRARLRQVFVNLISNAIKFSDGAMPVTIDAKAGGGMVTVSVADRGAGIPADELPRVGERFFRASTARELPGTGLGLAIAREIVELHGGVLRIDSELGAGTTASVRLPLR